MANKKKYFLSSQRLKKQQFEVKVAMHIYHLPKVVEMNAPIAISFFAFYIVLDSLGLERAFL